MPPTPAPVSMVSLPERPLQHIQGLLFLISKQANVRSEQLSSIETIDEIFEGFPQRKINCCWIWARSLAFQALMGQKNPVWMADIA